MRIKIGKNEYKDVEPKKLNEKQKKLINIGKKRRKRRNISLDLSDKLSQIYATIAEKYLIMGRSDQHIINEVNRLLNKNKRLRRRYGL